MSLIFAYICHQTPNLPQYIDRTRVLKWGYGISYPDGYILGREGGKSISIGGVLFQEHTIYDHFPFAKSIFSMKKEKEKKNRK